MVHGAKLIPMSVSVSFLLNYADSLQLISHCKIVNEDMKGKKSILSESEQSRDERKKKSLAIIRRTEASRTRMGKS